MRRLPLPLCTVVITVRPITDSATSPIVRACGSLSQMRVTSASVWAQRHAINSRFPEPFPAAVRVSLSLNASMANATLARTILLYRWTNLQRSRSRRRIYPVPLHVAKHGPVGGLGRVTHCRLALALSDR